MSRTRWTLIGIGLGLILAAGLEIRWRRAELARKALETLVKRQKLEAVVRDQRFNAVVGQLATQREINRQLSEKQKEFLKAAKKADPKARIDTHATTTVRIEDQPKAHVIQVAGEPPECRDEYHRFRVLTRPDGTCAMWRKQEFRVDALFVRSPDGKTRVENAEFWEYDPETGAVVPVEGINMKSSFTFADELPEKPPIIHPRLVLGVDNRLAIGAGVELLNLERVERPFIEKLSISLLGFWDRKTNELRPAALLNYRLLNTNLSVGAGVALSGGRVSPVAAATFQVTR